MKGNQTMKRLLLAGTLLATLTAFPIVDAKAACVTPPTGTTQNGVTLFQCDSDNQATDEDDVKFFINRATGVSSIDGSLNKNSSTSTFENISVFGDAAFNQEGNGFADLHSANAGSVLNTLHDVTFDPRVPSTVTGLFGHAGIPFLGFDGFIGRGQVDALGGTGPESHRTWDGIVTLEVLFHGSSTPVDFVFNGDTRHDDIGAIGFDERGLQASTFIDSVTMHLDSTGAWNEVKQFDFSIPGGAATIPEPSTWVLLGVGFALLGSIGFAKRRNRLSAAL
jgi:hypothetical protein